MPNDSTTWAPAGTTLSEWTGTTCTAEHESDPATGSCYLDATMLPPQWMDVGMFLQTVMLLFRCENMDTCPQIAWAEYHETVAEVLEAPESLVLACGMTIGFCRP
jgi:hypothetical protein